ncbi:MAG: phosphoribosyltransferase family protein [Nanoarchaeota archaeon]|nr:phosphoribosyltransferase family protein [Nanoarchaeota archaeon]
MIQDLISRLKQLSVVERGTVELKNARTSDYYINIKKAYGDPELMFLLCKNLWEKIPKEVTCIAGSGHGGIPLATRMSGLYACKLALVRDGPKEHGMIELIDGHMPSSKDKVAIIDDVFSTGGSLRKVIEILQPTGAEIIGCYVIVKRGEGVLPVPWQYLMTAEELL